MRIDDEYKRVFEESIEAIERKVYFEEKFNDLLKEADADGYVFFGEIDCLLLKVWSLILGDKSDWISYFCWELDFGKKWKPGTIEDENGKDIKLQTVEDLWVILSE